MKKNKKKLKGFIFLLPIFICMFLMCILPIFFALIKSKTLNGKIFEIITLILVIVFVVLLFLSFLEAIYCIIDCHNNKKIKGKYKYIWYILLFIFNLFIIPYYYVKYILKSKKFNEFRNGYIITILVFSIISILTTNYLINTYIKIEKVEKAEKIRKEKIRNIYTSKNDKFEMSFKLGFKKYDVNEYDLYVKDNNKNIITGAFLYNISSFEEKTPEAVLNKQVEYLKNSKENINVYKELSTRSIDNKIIYSIELSGNGNDTNDCIYKLSTLSIDNDNIIYIIQVVLKKDYKKYTKQLDEIVDSIKIK